MCPMSVIPQLDLETLCLSAVMLDVHGGAASTCCLLLSPDPTARSLTPASSLPAQVKAMLKNGSAAKRKAANFFFAASVAWVRASRVRAGMALQYAREPRPLPALLRALAVTVLLYPLHR